MLTVFAHVCACSSMTMAMDFVRHSCDRGLAEMILLTSYHRSNTSTYINIVCKYAEPELGATAVHPFPLPQCSSRSFPFLRHRLPRRARSDVYCARSSKTRPRSPYTPLRPALFHHRPSERKVLASWRRTWCLCDFQHARRSKTNRHSHCRSPVFMLHCAIVPKC